MCGKANWYGGGGLSNDTFDMIGMQHVQVVMNYKLVGTTDNDALYYVE